MFGPTDFIAWMGIGFFMAGMLFYPLAAIMAAVKAFKSI